MKHLVSLASLLTALYSSLLFAAEAPQTAKPEAAAQQPFQRSFKMKMDLQLAARLKAYGFTEQSALEICQNLVDQAKEQFGTLSPQTSSSNL